MGQVFRARDRELGRDVAIKVMLEIGSDDERRRFLREAAALSRVDHPNLVRLFDYGEEPEGPYLVMELLEGQPLDEAGAPPLDAVLQIAEGLEAIHAAGLVHRDVKPGNVLWTRDGRAVLLDFGIVRDPDAATLTQEGYILGTVPYMAPEVLREIRWGPACDWYALGVTLYELEHGRTPWTSREVLARVSRKGWPPPALGITQADRVARACLVEDTTQRPHGRAALEAEAREDDPGEAPAVTQLLSTRSLPPSSPAPPGRRRIWLVPALLLAVTAGWWMASGGAPEATTSGGPAHPASEDAEQFRSVDVEARLREAISRESLAGEDPWAYPDLWRRVPEVTSFRAWLRAGNDPETLSLELRARLRAADEAARDRGLPRPYFPYVYDLPVGLPADHPEVPSGSGPWFYRAREAQRRWRKLGEELLQQVEEGRLPAEMRGLALGPAHRWINRIDAFLGMATVHPSDRLVVARWSQEASDELRACYYAYARADREEDIDEAVYLHLRPRSSDLKAWFHGGLLALDPEALVGGSAAPPGAAFLRAELESFQGRARHELSPVDYEDDRAGLRRARDAATASMRQALAAKRPILFADSGLLALELANGSRDEVRARFLVEEVVASLRPRDTQEATELAVELVRWVGHRRPEDPLLAAFERLEGPERRERIEEFYPLVQAALRDGRPLVDPQRGAVGRAFRDPEVADRLEQAIRRRGLRELAPSEYHRLWAGIPEVEGFRAWLRAGNHPEDLSAAIQARLREADSRVATAGLPRPYFPYVYELPAEAGDDEVWLRRARAAQAAWNAEVDRLDEEFRQGRLPAALARTDLGLAAAFLKDIRACVQLAASQELRRKDVVTWMRPLSEQLRAWQYAAARAGRAQPLELDDIVEVRPERDHPRVWFLGELLSVDAEALHGGPDPPRTTALLLSEFLSAQAQAHWELRSGGEAAARHALRTAAERCLELFRAAGGGQGDQARALLARDALDAWAQVGDDEATREVLGTLMAEFPELESQGEEKFGLEVVRWLTRREPETSPYAGFLQDQPEEAQWAALPQAYAWFRREFRR
jgi:hypothetical protein